MLKKKGNFKDDSSSSNNITSLKLTSSGHNASTMTRATILKGPHWTRWDPEIVKSNEPYSNKKFETAFNPPSNTLNFLGGLGPKYARPRSKLHPTRPTMIQKLFNMRTGNRALYSFTEEPQIMTQLLKKKSSHITNEIQKRNRMTEIVKEISLADNVITPKGAENLTEDMVVVRTPVRVPMKKQSLSESSEGAPYPYYYSGDEIKRITSQSLDIGTLRDNFLVDKNLDDEECTFQEWAVKFREELKSKKFDYTIESQETDRKSTDNNLKDMQQLIGIVDKVYQKKIRHISGTLYGPFPAQKTFDKFTKNNDKFNIPKSMSIRAQINSEKQKQKNIILRRARLQHMKVPLPPPSDGSSDETLENVKTLTLVKTPYFIFPRIKIRQRPKKNRLRNRFMNKNQLERINMLLYERSEPYPPERVKPKQAEVKAENDKKVVKSRLDCIKKLMIKTNKSSSERQQRYGTFVRKCNEKQIELYEVLMEKDNRDLSFENFKKIQSFSPETEEIDAVKEKVCDTTGRKTIETSKEKKTPSVKKAHLCRPPSIFNRKRNIKWSKEDNLTGPYYLDPDLMDKFRNPHLFTRSQKYYTSLIRERPGIRQRLQVNAPDFEEEQLGEKEKYLHRLATEWDDSYINDLRHRPRFRKFCVKTDILQMREAIRKKFIMYFITENLLALLEKQKVEQDCIAEVDNFSKVCDDFLTNLKNTSYNNVIIKTQSVKPLQEETKILMAKYTKLTSDIDRITEELLEIENQWDLIIQLQNYYYILMETDWRQKYDWIHRDVNGQLEEPIYAVHKCMTINIRPKTEVTGIAIKEFFTTKLQPHLEAMESIKPDAELLKQGLQMVKLKVFTYLNQFNRTFWFYKIFLQRSETFSEQFQLYLIEQRQFLEFRSERQNFIDERNHLLSHKVQQITKKPLKKCVKNPDKLKIRAICDQLYIEIIPSEKRCNQVDQEMTTTEKFAITHDFIMQLLEELDRLPTQVLKYSERQTRENRYLILEQSRRAVIKQTRFDLMKRQIEGHFTKTSKKSPPEMDSKLGGKVRMKLLNR